VSSENFISISEIITWMNTGRPFSITYITWDHQRGRGGSVKAIEQAVKHYQADKEDYNAAIRADKPSLRYSLRNPNHFHNSTVNIRVTAAGNADIRKVHYQLIRRFNGAIVK